MGEVHLAQDTSELGRTVALKILSSEVAGNKDRLQRFIQEARTVSNLNHPNILTVHEFGTVDSTSFMVTEFVDGVTLRQHTSSRRLKLIEVMDVVIQIVGALNAAHEAGVTHRDLKPENLMVRRDHIVKVLDFGLAKLSAKGRGDEEMGRMGDETNTLIAPSPGLPAPASPVTEPGVVMGTVSYMSPEQSIGKGVDHRSDIWSVGVVLYEMLAGSVPFPGKDIHRQIIAIQETEPAPLAQQVEGIPERLEEIVSKCLAKEKDERYQSAKDLLIDLRNLRRKLDVDAEIERTVAPNLRSTSAGAAQMSTPGTQSAAGVTIPEQSNPTSSAEYIVTGIKQHKLALALVALVLVAGLAVLGVYWRTAKNDDAIKSIAVMPFENTSGNADSEYLSDGMAESLIYRLSQLPDLKVSPTSSVKRYKGKEVDAQKIGSELGVSAVMTGRMMQRGDNLMLSVELIDVRNNKLIWGEQYERKLSELLTTQREIATEIVQNLKLKLSGEGQQKLTKKYTDNNDAYQLYLKGSFHYGKRTKEDLEKGIDYFQQAIKLDPEFALAYVGISQTYATMTSYSYISAKDGFSQSKPAAQKALEIDSSLADAHATLAMTLATYDWNWSEAEREFKRALELNPNVASIHYEYGLMYLIPMKRTDEGIQEIERAIDLEPLSIPMNANLGGAYMYAHQSDAALEQAKKTFELEPGHVTARIWLENVYESRGMFREELALIEETLKTHPSDQYALQYAAYAYAKTGRRPEAEAALSKLRELEKTEPVDAFGLVGIHIALGDKERAFAELERSFEDRSFYMCYLQVDPVLDPLRDDPRFKSLVKRVGLPQ
jgi:serine/threonine-protein kinase